MSKLYDGSPGMLLVQTEDAKLAVKYEEGTGDNLLEEDIREGYVDYMNWESFLITCGEDDCLEDMPVIEPLDGGMALLKRYARDMTEQEIADAVMREATA